MLITSEDIKDWLFKHSIGKLAISSDWWLIVKTKLRHFQMSVGWEGVVGSRLCWGTESFRPFEVSFNDPDFYGALEQELEPSFPDWPREPMLGGICDELREAYGHEAVSVECFTTAPWVPPTESLILIRKGRCYEFYIQDGRLIIGAESYKRNTHKRELELGHPCSLDRIELLLKRLARDPIGCFSDFTMS